MTEYDEIIIVMDNVSKKTNNMPTKITQTTATRKTMLRIVIVKIVIVKK